MDKLVYIHANTRLVDKVNEVDCEEEIVCWQNDNDLHGDSSDVGSHSDSDQSSSESDTDWASKSMSMSVFGNKTASL